MTTAQILAVMVYVLLGASTLNLIGLLITAWKRETTTIGCLLAMLIIALWPLWLVGIYLATVAESFGVWKSY